MNVNFGSEPSKDGRGVTFPRATASCDESSEGNLLLSEARPQGRSRGPGSAAQRTNF